MKNPRFEPSFLGGSYDSPICFRAQKVQFFVVLGSAQGGRCFDITILGGKNKD